MEVPLGEYVPILMDDKKQPTKVLLQNRRASSQDGTYAHTVNANQSRNSGKLSCGFLVIFFGMILKNLDRHKR